MRTRFAQLPLVVYVAVLAAGCGGHRTSLGDGSWYGKVVAVDAQRRSVTFAPACGLSDRERWTAAATRTPVTLALAPHADLEIYYRPNGSVAAGHEQPLGLRQFKDVAEKGTLPDLPPGWFVTLSRHTATSIAEDSGLRSSR